MGKSAIIRSVLFVSVFVLGFGIGVENARGPMGPTSFAFIFLAAAARPIRQDGRILDRMILFTLAVLAGLSVWEFVKWLADYLFSSGIFDAGGAASVAGYRTILAVLSAYLATLINIRRFTDWIIDKWRAESPARISLVVAAILAPYAGLIAAIIVYGVMDFEISPFLALVIFTVAVIPILSKAIHWLFSLPLFELRGPYAEGSRRLGLLVGWVVGVPVSILILGSMTYWFDDEDAVIAIPFVAVIGLMLTYAVVQAIFWVIEGFESKPE